MSDFKVSRELRESIITYVSEARWYMKSSTHGYISDLEEMYMENGDKVADNIVNEVVSWLATKDIQTLQLRRIADSLEKLTGCMDGEGEYLHVRTRVA